MSGDVTVLVFAALALALLGLMLWGWRRRARRDAAVTAPLGELRGELRGRFGGLYVATTRHDAPLDRLNVRHLAYRSRVRVTVTAEGVALDMPGAPTVFVDAARIAGAGRATWTIDRVVERDGLVLLAWTADDGTVCDTYLRLQDGDPDALVAEVDRLRTDSASTPMGAL